MRDLTWTSYVNIKSSKIYITTSTLHIEILLFSSKQCWDFFDVSTWGTCQHLFLPTWVANWIVATTKRTYEECRKKEEEEEKFFNHCKERPWEARDPRVPCRVTPQVFHHKRGKPRGKAFVGFPVRGSIPSTRIKFWGPPDPLTSSNLLYRDAFGISVKPLLSDPRGLTRNQNPEVECWFFWELENEENYGR